MRVFTFYGIDRSGAVISSRPIKAVKPEDAAAEARKYLHEFHRIELWESTVLILRESAK